MRSTFDFTRFLLTKVFLGALVALLPLTACGGRGDAPATQVPLATDSTTSNTIIQASTVPPSATNSRRSDPTTRNIADLDASECRGCLNAAELIVATLSDSPDALQEFFGKWVRLGGRIVSVSGSGGTLVLEVPISGRSPSSIALQAEAEAKARDEWLEWVLSHDPGDVVEANCFIRANPAGHPLAVKCRPVKS